MRLSRPCYDKMHRCPGSNGGGTKYAKVEHCTGGRLLGRDDPDDLYGDRLWRFRTHRCNLCDVLVLPYVVRYLDPTYHRSNVRTRLRNLKWEIQYRLRSR